jgi:hypothetical protein
MEREDNNAAELVWAVVDSGTRRLIGKVHPAVKPSEIVTVEEAVELDCTITNLPGPQGQTVAVYSPSMKPIDIEKEPVKITAIVQNVRFFKDMRDRGQRYHAMYDNLLEQLEEVRARAAGIHRARGMPMPPGGPGGFVGPGGFGGGPRG